MVILIISMAGFKRQRRITNFFQSRKRGRFNGRSNGRFKRRFGTRTGARFVGAGNIRTGYDASNVNITFRRKKTSVKTYRRRLWNSTIMKAHFRSVQSSLLGTMTTLPATATVPVLLTPALSSVSPFWIAAGGAQPLDALVAVPLFSPSSIIIRGGVVKLSMTNRSVVNTIRVRVWLVWGKDNPGAAVAIPATAPRGWDPSLVADFSQGYRIIFGREVLLLPGAHPLEVEGKLHVQKIDTDAFVTDGGRKLYWIATVEEVDDSDGVASIVGFDTRHNLAFSGDAVV